MKKMLAGIFDKFKRKAKDVSNATVDHEVKRKAIADAAIILDAAIADGAAITVCILRKTGVSSRVVISKPVAVDVISIKQGEI